MKTENLSTLKIHKLTQAQYEREREAGRLDANALYLTPDEAIDLSGYVTAEQLDEAIDAIPTPDVSGQIEAHNTAADAHADMGWLTSEDAEADSPTPIDADTLGGHSVNYFTSLIDKLDARINYLEAICSDNMVYYSTLNKAVTDVNNGTLANADANKNTAVAGVYTDKDGGKNVVLLKDTTETKRITLSADMAINLGGNTITVENDYYGFDGTKNKAITVNIDGRLNGSTVILNGIDGGGCAIKIRANNNFVINGGSYVCNETAVNDQYSGVCISTGDGGSASIHNCFLLAANPNSNISTLQNFGTTTISRSNILGYSNYTLGEAEHYGVSSVGIVNKGALTINDCYVFGSHSGVEDRGVLYVNGGTYEGYGHGGFYFCGADTTYVRNAITRDCDMPDGYMATAGRNGAGFYVGGDNNINVYMDNCDISGVNKGQAFVLKDQNNSVYISNSRIEDGAKIRIDNETNKLYIGKGCNFAAEDTSLPSAVIVTDEVYVQAA